MQTRWPAKPTRPDGIWPFIAIAITSGAASALLLPGLGYDAWAWMIWAREITHLSLDTTTGSTIKPLPMLLMAPVARFGDAAPFLWLTIARSTFLLIPVFAWRIAANFGATRFGRLLAAVFSLLTPVLFDSAVTGYSEPLTALLILAAIWKFQMAHQRQALVFLALASLMRPELWPFIWVIAAWCAGKDYIRRDSAVVIGLAPIVIWAAISWAGAGVPFGGVSARESIRGATGLFTPLAQGVTPIVLIGFALAVVFALRGVNRNIGVLIWFCAAWVALFSLMKVGGFSGNARYLVPVSVVSAIIAAWGLDGAVGRITGPLGRKLAVGACALVALGYFALSFHTFRNSVSTFRTYADAAEGMIPAIQLAGGRDQVVALGKPVVMNWSRQTALAWQLNVPISGTQTIWRSDWTGGVNVPSVLIAAPPKVGGARASFPIRLQLRAIGRSGDWSVLRVVGRIAKPKG